MKNQALIFLIGGLVVGIGGTTLAMRNKTDSAPTNSSRMDGMAGMDMSSSPASGSSMSMSEMTNELKGLSGDAFDKKFVAEMIAHHQGAIDMANLAKSQAKHDEIKKMADDIISAQTGEVATMQGWKKDWGY
jgi:uncharacterized protein (DUF305 family)